MGDRIKAIFFDVGGTLVDYDNTAVCLRIAQLSEKSVTVSMVRQLLYGTEEDEGLYTPDSLIYNFNVGAFGVKQFIKTVRRRLGIQSNVTNACIRDGTKGDPC
ncbi:MAG: hypothetical protein A3C07_02230 [Candidatus Sungbacteria bacterium RIFCSPHIGHO2_02_FULL_47_11]|uniref:Uncharacterized protein n=1 Tax=Candidatus Sungbacteria bacterium RIFCSPHIGHO2_02_FULL_47_11 TaxID=1802270 RepID=A0A1G2KN64_9BACT|nr:MAG: hypothetical protein A3C07_02230 [Candidatus Sungbacteria bacterium RIFCSPHIGHO2_02_FULL_47_11]